MELEREEEGEGLDISWIKEHEKVMNINNQIIKEPMGEITIHFIYLNTKNYIEKIFVEKEILKEKAGSISKERILKIVQSNRENKNNKKYRLFDLLLFNINLEAENIPWFSSGDNHTNENNKFFSILPIFNDIKISDSLFIFHSINSLYIIYKESEKKKYIPILKPILKKTKKVVEKEEHNITKKVLFSEKEKEGEREKEKFNKTKKIHPN